MKTRTADFKTNIKTLGREFSDVITYTENNTLITISQEDINSITLHYSTGLLKSTMRQLEIDVNQDIEIGTVIKYQLGLKVENSYEYLDFGNYIVYSSEKQEDLKSYKIICYDKMLLSMIDYTNLNVQYPITIRNYIQAICDFLGLTFKNANDEFANYDKEIENEVFLDEENNSLGYKFRDVLDDLAEVVAGNICINENDDELEIRYINETNDTIDEEFLKDTNVNFSKKVGPINSIVLSRSASSDNVYLRDDESVEENGLYEIKIEDNQIMNFNNRSEYLPDILEKLDGVEYYLNNIKSTGVCYYNVYDMYNITIDENTYPCLMLNDEILRTQGLEENIVTEESDSDPTDYSKADKTDLRINQTNLIVDKQQGEINALTTRVQSVEDETGNMYTIEQVNELIQNAESGITNTFSEAGGNNILRNTGLWFENSENDSEQNPYEFWTGTVQRVKEENSANLNALLLKNDTLTQIQNVPNGKYTISFYCKKLIALSNVSLFINDVEYELENSVDEKITFTFDVTSKVIKIQFVCDIDNGCEIYDLMINAGEVALAYSQNQNETTTDTVNISKGITITSSNTDTIFKANSDGIRTLDKSGNELTKFTDTGMTTKKMIVQDTSQIVGLLFQEVDGQTWITRL